LADPEWVRKLIIGCAITVVPLLNLACLGYFVACARLGAKGRHALPEWDQWGNYFKDGFLTLTIAAVYMLIPLIVLAFGINAVVVRVLAAICGFMVPIAVSSFAITHDLNQAFNLAELNNKMRRAFTHYLLAYLASLVVLSLALVILSNVPLLAFLSAFLVFYSGIVYCNYVGWILYGID
jgi:hypothetical protein